ncbi:24770_t:CDS:1, partial [Cetraspora pellucida]
IIEDFNEQTLNEELVTTEYNTDDINIATYFEKSLWYNKEINY